MGLEVVENLLLLPSQHSVPLKLEIASEFDLETQTASVCSPHAMAEAAFPISCSQGKDIGICLRDR